MQSTGFFFFMVAALVCWRVTHLLNKEDGPFEIIFLLRKKAGAGFFGNLLDCFYCLSLWTALPLGIWMGNGWIEKLLFWWAVSGAACLLQLATNDKKNKGDEPVQFKED